MGEPKVERFQDNEKKTCISDRMPVNFRLGCTHFKSRGGGRRNDDNNINYHEEDDYHIDNGTVIILFNLSTICEILKIFSKFVIILPLRRIKKREGKRNKTKRNKENRR